MLELLPSVVQFYHILFTGKGHPFKLADLSVLLSKVNICACGQTPWSVVRTTPQMSSAIQRGLQLETLQPQERLIHMNKESRSGQKGGVVIVLKVQGPKNKDPRCKPAEAPLLCRAIPADWAPCLCKSASPLPSRPIALNPNITS